jgi:hypothetical protein
MTNPLTNIVRKWKYGEPIVVVSGLPRSGTSMVMSMLQAGGLPVLTDHLRAADEDNPRGYFEFEKVKALGEKDDKTWLREARGKAIKVISHLLKELPDDNFYRIIFARRDLEEVIASQNIMLERQDEFNPVDDAKAIELYRKHLVNVRFLVRRKPNLEMIELAYSDTLSDPGSSVERINRFLDGQLNLKKMSSIVDKRLYRNRKERSEASRNNS